VLDCVLLPWLFCRHRLPDSTISSQTKPPARTHTSLFPKLSDSKSIAVIDAVLNEYVPNLVRAFQNPYN